MSRRCLSTPAAAGRWNPVRRLAVAFGLYASLLTLTADRVTGQSRETPPLGPSHLLRACPPGHRVEFRYASTSLYIDLNWLDVISLVYIVERSGPNCPKQPILDLPLFFRTSILELANVPDDLGRTFFFFVLEGASKTRQMHPSLFQTRPWVLQNPPGITDITADAFPTVRPSPSSRVYLLRYLAESDGSDTTVVVSCGGDILARRECFLPIPYRFRRDLDINYKFRQSALPIPGISEATPGGLNEPEGVLEFDIRIRAWIESLMQKP
jgi:plasmid stabilization system protein ParE